VTILSCFQKSITAPVAVSAGLVFKLDGCVRDVEFFFKQLFKSGHDFRLLAIADLV
jgi:hypothetical protein